MSIDVNGHDNTPEWGYCKAAQGCKEEAFPIWKSGDAPDDPDLLLCPKHLGLLIGDLSRQIGEQNTTIGYQDAMLARATADALVLRQALARAQTDVCSLNCPSTWRTADGPPPHSEKCQAISALLSAAQPGAALLAELEAARAVVAAAAPLAYYPRLADALMAYRDAAAKARE